MVRTTTFTGRYVSEDEEVLRFCDLPDLVGLENNAMKARKKRLERARREGAYYSCGFPWTPAEDDILRRMWAHDHNDSVIGRKLGRSRFSVRSRRYKLRLIRETR